MYNVGQQYIFSNCCDDMPRAMLFIRVCCPMDTLEFHAQHRPTMCECNGDDGMPHTTSLCSMWFLKAMMEYNARHIRFVCGVQG